MGYVVNPRFTLTLIDLDDATVVASGGGTNTKSLTPDDGIVYEVINIGYSAAPPIGATANSHDIEATYQGDLYRILKITSNFNAGIYINQLGFGGTTDEPSGIDEQYKIMRERIFVTNAIHLDIVYTNDTDANQTGTRNCKILVKKYAERP